MQEVTGSTDVLGNSTGVEMIYNKQSNTMVKFTASPRSFRNNMRRTKTERKRDKLVSKLTFVQLHFENLKQERINSGAAKIIGLSLSHIYANKPV